MNTQDLSSWVKRSEVQELIAAAIESERLRCAGIARGWLNLAQTKPGRKVARGILRQIENGDPGF